MLVDVRDGSFAHPYWCIGDLMPFCVALLERNVLAEERNVSHIEALLLLNWLRLGPTACVAVGAGRTSGTP